MLETAAIIRDTRIPVLGINTGRLGFLSLEPLRPKRARYQPSRNRPTAHGPAPAPASPAMLIGSSPTRHTFRLERPFARRTQMDSAQRSGRSNRVCERVACSCDMRPCRGCHRCRALAPMLRTRLRPGAGGRTRRPVDRSALLRARAIVRDCMRCDGLLLHCGRDVPARRFVRTQWRSEGTWSTQPPPQSRWGSRWHWRAHMTVCAAVTGHRRIRVIPGSMCMWLLRA